MPGVHSNFMISPLCAGLLRDESKRKAEARNDENHPKISENIYVDLELQKIPAI